MNLPDLAALRDLATLERQLVLLLATMARVGPILWLAPFLGGQVVPASVKVSLTAAVGVLLFAVSGAQPDVLAGASTLYLVILVCKEGLVGLAMGFMVGTVFWAMQVGGHLVDTFRGAAAAETLVHTGQGRETPTATLLLYWTVVMFFALGGHRLVLMALARSYVVLPLAELPQLDGVVALVRFCIRMAGELLLMGLALSAPVLGSLLLADLSLGWLNRFAPQLNAYFVAMPFKALLGLAVLVLVVGIAGLLPEIVATSVRQLERGIELLAR